MSPPRKRNSACGRPQIRERKAREAEEAIKAQEEADYQALRQTFQPAFNNTFVKLPAAKSLAFTTSELLEKMGLPNDKPGPAGNAAKLNKYLGVSADKKFKRLKYVKYDFEFNRETKPKDFTIPSNIVTWHCFALK